MQQGYNSDNKQRNKQMCVNFPFSSFYYTSHSIPNTNMSNKEEEEEEKE